ncbi:MAG: Smr/MutS family protein [Deltaproteobacteria bacterium]|jgi:DNA-nicking Smr family endonuclease|nr:Smr/MutS family protein [Deltaproteobacteria bacterium]
MNTKTPPKKKGSEDKEDVFTQLMEENQITPLKKNQNNKSGHSCDHFEIKDNITTSATGNNHNSKYSGIEKVHLKSTHTKRIKINRHFQADFSLDLHGETRESALQKARYAFRIAKQKQYQSLLIITGKGTNSKQSVGIIKSVIWDWLSYEKNEGTIASFKIAPNFLGGGGAILVFFY